MRRHRLATANQSALHQETTRMLQALGLADDGEPPSDDEGRAALTAAAVREWTEKVSQLQNSLADAEDALAQERARRGRRATRRPSGAVTSPRLSRGASAGDAAVVAAADGDEAADAESRTLEASMQTVEDTLARSRRMLDEWEAASVVSGDPDADTASGAAEGDDAGVRSELDGLRDQLSRMRRARDDAMAEARAAPAQVLSCHPPPSVTPVGSSATHTHSRTLS
jgi:hypothetical protein